MAELPRGTVTLLFTDIEGSTRLLQELGPERYVRALEDHRRLLREVFASHGGVEVEMQGDSFHVAFAEAREAVLAAADAQLALDAHEWEVEALRVRIGVHTGEPLVSGGLYAGLDVHRAARVMSAGHGGQVLVSETTRQLVAAQLPRELSLRDLGEHRLKDLLAPHRLYQLGGGEFPPLATLHRTNLPVLPTPFLGREAELAAVITLLARDDVRVVTLTGPGGTGKTRLALQAAAEAADGFPEGITWVPLAPLTESSPVAATIARALEIGLDAGANVGDVLVRSLAGRRCLLVLDNAEHLLPDLARELSALTAVEGPTLLVTSRERLQLQGEHVYAVPTMEEADAVALFTTRARAVGVDLGPEPSVWALCRNLDNLPLAVELAAARTVLFSPEQLLERLGQRLDLLRGGRDADPRQQTLRATIAWSHDLLDDHERRLFARLSIFIGGCTYDAAEAVAGADPDTLQSLVDKSILRRRDAEPAPRFSMLETIREFAAAEREDRSEADALRRDHSTFYADLVASRWEEIARGDESALLVVDAELGNIRAGLHDALARSDGPLLCAYLYGLFSYWLSQGLGSEAVDAARAWLALDSTALEAGERAAGLLAASEILRFTGDASAAIELKLEFLSLVRAHPDVQAAGRPVRAWIAATLTDVAHLLVDAGRVAEARTFADEALAIRREAGTPFGIAHAQLALVTIADASGDPEGARELAATAADLYDTGGWQDRATDARAVTAEYDLLLGDTAAASQMLARAVSAARQSRDWFVLHSVLRVAAAIALDHDEPARAALLFSVAERLRSDGRFDMRTQAERERDQGRTARLTALIDAETLARAAAQGAEADTTTLLSEVETWLRSVVNQPTATEVTMRR